MSAGQEVIAPSALDAVTADCAPRYALTSPVASWKWADGKCAHFGCERAATDERHGFALCMGHFFQAVQWDVARQGAEA